MLEKLNQTITDFGIELFPRLDGGVEPEVKVEDEEEEEQEEEQPLEEDSLDLPPLKLPQKRK